MTTVPKPDIEAVVKAGSWAAIELVIRNLGQFGFGIVLARLLVPAEFGLVALAGFFTATCGVLTQSGIQTALIQDRHTDHGQESALFWGNLALALALAAAIACAGPRAARFFAQPMLRDLLLIAALTIVIASLGAVHNAMLIRALRFRELCLIGLAATCASGVVGIGMAWHGLGAWSLAVMLLVGATMQTAALWWCSAWRPTLSARPARAGSLARSAMWIAGAGLVDALYNQGATPLIGKLFGVRAVGLFNRGVSTQAVLVSFLTGMVARLALPVFSAHVDDEPMLRRGLRTANSLMTVITLPAMIGMCLTAPLVIEVFYGTAWAEAGPILRIVALAGIFYPISLVNLQLLLAQQKSKKFFRIEITKKSIGIALLLAASNYGVLALSWAMVLASIVAVVLNSWPTRALVRYPLSEQLWDLRQIALPTSAMAAIVTAVLQTVRADPEILLISAVISGIAVYVAVGLILRLSHFTEGLRMAAILFRKQV